MEIAIIIKFIVACYIFKRVFFNKKSVKIEAENKKPELTKEDIKNTYKRPF